VERNLQILVEVVIDLCQRLLSLARQTPAKQAGMLLIAPSNPGLSVKMTPIIKWFSSEILWSTGMSMWIKSFWWVW
jgi:hypothetical protein